MSLIVIAGPLKFCDYNTLLSAADLNGLIGISALAILSNNEINKLLTTSWLSLIKKELFPVKYFQAEQLHVAREWVNLASKAGLN